MEPLKYETQPTAQSTPPILPAPKKPKKQRGHGFLLTLLALMAISLIVWAFFLYVAPPIDGDMELYSDSYAPKPTPLDTSSIEADLSAAGTIDNSDDIKGIDQAFAN